MNYELAKQLKNNGFPIKKALPDSTSIWGGKDTNGTYYEYPTLSELIEACETPFLLRYVLEDLQWQCGNGEFIGEGSTPEEAVAKLWLELNKK